MKTGYSVSRFLKPLDVAPVQAYLSDELQVPDILEWILSQTGRARVIQTTFSISEEYLRRLHSIREKGLVSRLEMVLDFKATNKTVDLWVFISKVVDTASLTDNHSKILLVEAENGRRVSVVTSQNLTRGNRAESAVVAESKDIFNTLYDQLMQIVKVKSISIDDILSGTD